MLRRVASGLGIAVLAAFSTLALAQTASQITPPSFRPNLERVDWSWQSRTAAGCFGTVAVSDDTIGAFSAQTEPGRVVFRDARWPRCRAAAIVSRAGASSRGTGEGSLS